jgi:hypothetical protein
VQSRTFHFWYHYHYYNAHCEWTGDLSRNAVDAAAAAMQSFHYHNTYSKCTTDFSSRDPTISTRKQL